VSNVELKQAVKKFGDITVIHGIDLQLNSGEFVVFVGPSGCGKSTLLVFQSYALYPHMSVEQNMGFGLKMTGVDKQEVAEKVGRAAKTLQLDQLLDRKPKNLSGGQRQRVAIGRAIVREPEVFLFDEPLSNLDAELRVEMRLQIARLHEQIGATMIYVTHDQVEAMTMADRIVVLRLGHVEQVGTPLELYHHPKNLFVAGFIGSPKMNFIKGILKEGSANSAVIEVAGQTISLPVNAENAVAGSGVTLGMRPEDLGGTDGDFTLPLHVDVAERLGGSTYLYGSCADLVNFVVQRTGLDTTKHGETIDVHIHTDHCHLFAEDETAFQRLTDAGKDFIA